MFSLSLRARLAALAATGVIATGVTHAQPDPSPRAPVKDEQQLAATLSAITQDPSVPVDDPATRALAQALMLEGVKQLQARAFDQALANFLEAYARFPNPKILLNVASTLRDMGRLADAANTYQRYLLDPATGAERVGEVKQLLLDLDQQLTILTVRVFPRGSDVSIDGGPFIPVGSSLLTRVRPGLHLVRTRKDTTTSELTVNGFEGENKEVSATVKVEVPPDTIPPDTVDVRPPDGPAVSSNLLSTPDEIAEHVDGWLITGTQYASEGATSRERKVRTGSSGPTISAIVPRYESNETGEAFLVEPDDDTRITSGVVGVLRIDGEGRGFAGGLGLAISRGQLEAELMVLKSDSTGGYLGLRYRFLTGWLRPYIAGGVPGFAYDDDMEATKLALGLRGAAGVELKINGHLSVKGDLGYEHFFIDEDVARFDANIFVPTLGVIGRL